MADEVIRDIINAERDALEELYKSGECEGFPEKGFWLTDSKTLRKSYAHWEKVAYEKYLWELRFERKKRQIESRNIVAGVDVFRGKIIVSEARKKMEYNERLIENAKMLIKYHYDYSSIQRLESLKLRREWLGYEMWRHQMYLKGEQEIFKYWCEQLERLLAKHRAGK